jgi:uncharacterized protein involved in exopolysaccharide biosynthesis/Mrp family chromosome partitioning ATPase
MEETQAKPISSTQVVNPLLGQIHDFIQTDEPAPMDPLGMVTRAMRGRVRHIAIMAFAIAALFGFLAWLAIDPIYQSTAAVRILPREAKLLYADADDTRSRLYDAFVTAEVHLMQSRPILESAWQKMVATEQQDFVIPSDVGKLGNLFTVSNRKGLVTVAARSGNPTLSAVAVNSVLDSYESYKDSARDRLNKVRRTELEVRAKALTSTLQELDESYLQIAGEHDLNSLSKAHVAKTAQLEVLEERIGEVENTIAQFLKTGSIGADDIRNAEIQRALLLDQALAEMTYERASRLAALTTLRSRYQPTHAKIRSAELELATLEEAITERRDQITTLGNVGALTGGASQSSQQSLDELHSVREKLLTRRVDVSKEASDLIGKLVKIRRIFAEQGRVSDLLDETKQALDEVIVESQAGLSRSIDVIARGKVPDGPIEDKRRPIAFGAALFGALGLLVSIVLASIFNPRVRFSDDLGPEVSKKTLAVIPSVHSSQSDLQLAGFNARNEIDMRGTAEGSPLIIGVAGTTTGGRPERMALSLANAFAARDSSVLLIDADPNRAVASELELGEQCGLADILESTVSLPKAVSRISTDHGEISVLGAGMRCSDSLLSPISTITIRDYRALIDRAASDHDVIVFALGALSAGKQSALGASVSDHFVLTTSAGDRKRDITDAMTLLDRVIPDRYFLVMNRASPLDPMLEREDGGWERFGGFLNQLTLTNR